MRECYWCGKARGHDQGCPGERPQPSHEPVKDEPPRTEFGIDYAIHDPKYPALRYGWV